MEYLLKASVVITIFYLCYKLFLQRETFFQSNRWFLLVGLITALIFPLIVIPVYITIEPIVISETAFYIDETTGSKTIQQESGITWKSLLPIAYITGLIVFLVKFLLQFGSLILLLLKNPKQKDGLYTYIIVKSKVSPFSFFKWIVYNPKQFNDKELQLILNHEKVHAQQYHSIDILATNFACVIFWFNPIVWLYKKDIQQNLEYIADSKAQNEIENIKDYQRLLLKTSISTQINLTNNFYNSLIKKRIVMLNTSKSKTERQWKIALILPLLAIFLMSFNTKTFFIEKASDNTTTNYSEKETLEFKITKNTSDSELKAMTEAVVEKGGSLKFSKLSRNSNNEINSIFVSFYNHSYGISTDDIGIESFILYKELFGDGGGYVGRIEGATLHFDDIKNNLDRKKTKALTERAQKAILRNNIQSKTELDALNKLWKSQKTKKRLLGCSIQIIFYKDMTDADLKKIENELKADGVTMTITNIKRNKEGEITAIDIDFKTKNGSANYNNEDENGIKPFYFKIDENNAFGVGRFNATSKVHNHQKTDHIYFNNQQIDTVDIHNVQIDTLHVKNIVTNSFWIDRNGQKDSNVLEKRNKFIIRSNGDTPLYIVDGEEVLPAKLNLMDVKKIESISVLKDKSSVKLYGKKGENGVVIIKTKGDTSKTNKDNWTYAVGVENMANTNSKTITAIGYVDNRNTHKNSTLAYISMHSSDKVLKQNKSSLEKLGIKTKYSKLKRNKAGEIIRLKIILKDKNGNETSTVFKNDDGISGISYGKFENELIITSNKI